MDSAELDSWCAAIETVPSPVMIAVLITCPKEIVSRSIALGSPSVNACRITALFGRKLSFRLIRYGVSRRNRIRISPAPQTAVENAVAIAAPFTPRPAPGIEKRTPSTSSSRVG